MDNSQKQDLYSGLNGRQVLLMDAYIEDCSTWEMAKEDIESRIHLAITELNNANNSAKSTSSIRKFFYNTILKKPTPAETRLIGARDVLEHLTGKMGAVLNSEPQQEMYELAMLGNNLFKPR